MTLLDIDGVQFRANYNRRPFLIRHRLAEHPLVQLDALRALAVRLPSELVQTRVRPSVADDFDATTGTHPDSNPVGRIFDNLETAGTSVQMSTPERDPAYELLIGEILANLRAFTEPVDPTMTYTAAYFFVAGPGCTTPYHMDREMNFLLHIRGPKELTLWDPWDDEIMSARDRERLFSQWWRPPYRPEFESKAKRFELRPGDGLHHPFIAPHTARTGGEPSVSLAVTFRTVASDRTTAAYRMNHRLRRLGLKPTPVGTVSVLDTAKAATSRAWDAIRSRASRLGSRVPAG